MIFAFLIILAIIVIAILGTPLFIVIALSAIINFVRTPDSGGIQNVILEMTKIADMPLLHSIPLFTFAGYLLAHSKASKRLVRLTKAALGWMPGGLAIVTVLVCSVFTAFTGASGVTIVALGGLLLPALMSEKYKEKYSLGLVTSSGSFGLLFPPSLPVILFGVIASMAAASGSGSSVKINDLFIAGLVPGSLMILVLSGHAMIRSIKDKVFVFDKTAFTGERFKAGMKEFFWALIDAIFEIPLPIILIFGIGSGILVISDAAVITVIYIFIVEVFIKRDIKIKNIPEIMKESMVLVGAILIILCVSLAATNFIIFAQIPQKLFAFIQNYISNKWVFLILLNIFLLIVGCIMDIFSALVVVVPLILPIAESYNISLIHLGVIFLANLQIGYITPPVGMNLFIASIRFNKSIVLLYKSALIFIGLLLVSLVVITYVPGLSLWFLEKPSIVGQWEMKLDGGEADRINIKACGKYVRQKGSGIDMLMNSYYGDYEIKGNKIIFHNENGVEKYKYEIYNDGKRLLLENPDRKNKSNKSVSDEETSDEFLFSDATEDFEWDDDSVFADTEETDDFNLDGDEEYEWDDESDQLTDARPFYINVSHEPLRKNEGKFIAKWVNGDNQIEFYFDGSCSWNINGETKEYSYEILKGRKIKFYESINGDEYEYLYKYKFKDEKKLIIQSKENKKENYVLDFIESDSYR